MLYINTVIKVMITHLSITGICLPLDKMTYAPSIQGEHVMEEWPGHNTFHCPIRVARLCPERVHTFRPALLPPLFDVQALRINGAQLRTSGIENFVDKQQIREVAHTRIAKLP